MSNVTFFTMIRSWAQWALSFHIIDQFSLVCIIFMTFDLNLFININLRNELLRSELYGNVVLQIVYVHWFKINIWH